MTSEIKDFRGLMNRIKEGDADAVWMLVKHYGEDIRRAVRRSLNHKLRPKFDSLDFVQLVWSSFFRVHTSVGRFDQPEELAAFLVTMARNKVGMEVRRRLLSQKNNLNRESSLEEKSPAAREKFIAPEPTPLEFAIARERWDRILLDQPNHYRQIIQFRLQGRTCQDIADTMHMNESTVRRFLKRLFRETSV
jgi:RNA polymerase sigma factor (sigma-70 family)